MERLTRQRKIILEELGKVRTHPSAPELYIAVRKRIPRISLGTVYRNLEQLSREGAVMKITTDSLSRFDGHSEPHPHFLCEKCGAVFDMDKPMEVRFDKKFLERKFGCRVFGASLEVYGLCKKCR
ncbi:MAG: transcriptional repressor [Candidatus Micrarchaeota archaeon]